MSWYFVFPCMHTCACVLFSVVLCVSDMCKVDCTCLAGTVASFPASTWQWNVGNRHCRTTNGCSPKWRSMKKKKKLGPLWSNYIRYCGLKLTLLHMFVHSNAPSICRRAKFTYSYMLFILWIERNKWKNTNADWIWTKIVEHMHTVHVHSFTHASYQALK